MQRSTQRYVVKHREGRTWIYKTKYTSDLEHYISDGESPEPTRPKVRELKSSNHSRWRDELLEEALLAFNERRLIKNKLKHEQKRPR